MSTTSVGTGTPRDRNENPLADSEPSRTLGAESGPTEGTEPERGAPDVPGEVSDKAPSLTGVSTDPERIGQAFPEGPNVAPSPWEDEAARGRS